MNLPITLRAVLDRCKECPDCGAMSHYPGNPDKLPTIDLMVDGRRRKLYVRRVVWQLLNPRLELPSGEFEVITSTCPNRRCVNPKLIERLPKSQAWRRQAQEQRLRCAPTSIAKTVRAIRARSKLPEEGVEDIKHGGDSAAQAAKKWGITEAYVYMLRRGQFRRPLASPFAGLGAR